MTYPENFEQKIGFSDVRTLLKGRCLSSLGAEWAETKARFSSNADEVRGNLALAADYARFADEEEELFEENYYDVREALLRAKPERTYLEELSLFDLKRALQTVADLVRLFSRKGDETADGEPVYKYPALQRITEDVATFPELIGEIDRVLNKYGKVKDTASPELLSTRHAIETTTRSISHSLRSIIAEAQNEGYIDRDVAPTLRDGRLVIPVAPALKRKIKGIVHDESATGKTVFIEPASIVEANNRIRELKSAEKREIIRILQSLTEIVRPHIPAIIESQWFLARTDYLRALHSFSRSFGAIVPRIVDKPLTAWSGAVHPLLKQALERHGGTLVPLDIKIGFEKDGSRRIVLISGPNAGGKSVCLKTVGLLQYMLQCGMPIPVRENSTAGIYSDIMLDIGDQQSLENDLSTYSSHLLNMKHMLRNAGKGSLLLIDEFGGGTEPLIGGALAEAMLHRFVQSGASGIITTHFQNLKHYAETDPAVANAAMLYDRGEMRPLFVLQIGNPGSSFAIEIARSIGLPEDVISYAKQIVGEDYVMSDKYLQDITRDKAYWERKRQNIRQREKQLEETVTRYETELQELQKEKKQVITQAKEEAMTLLKASNAKIENTIREIRESEAERERTLNARQELADFKKDIEEKANNEDWIARKIAKIQRRQERKANKHAANNAGNAGAKPQNASPTVTPSPAAQQTVAFNVGDTVRMKGQTVVGIIERFSGGDAVVRFGIVISKVSPGRLEHAKMPTVDRSTQAVSFVSKETRDAIYEKKLQFKPDIDLRGMRGDEALRAVTVFIDDAIQLEYPRVRILHGTGTGALRQLIRQYLSGVNGVRSYADEHVQFGGAGITVVNLE